MCKIKIKGENPGPTFVLTPKPTAPPSKGNTYSVTCHNERELPTPTTTLTPKNKK